MMPLGLTAMLLISLAQGLFVLPCHLARSRLPGLPEEVPGFQRAVQRAIDRFVDRIYTPVFPVDPGSPGCAAGRSLSSLLVTAGLFYGGFTPFVAKPKLDWAFLYTYIEYPRENRRPRSMPPPRDWSRRSVRSRKRTFAATTGKRPSLVQTRFRSVGTTTSWTT
ncbi:MAG: hypothetical protein CM1200mP2_38480 [Planctomycetaceae bacterium]|nr:MAG: hypothetical protein CM1200mP2_38480 [Planctomycetaceae bacterium]